jgi:hypothetical protein
MARRPVDREGVRRARAALVDVGFGPKYRTGSWRDRLVLKLRVVAAGFHAKRATRAVLASGCAVFSRLRLRAARRDPTRHSNRGRWVAPRGFFEAPRGRKPACRRLRFARNRAVPQARPFRSSLSSEAAVGCGPSRPAETAASLEEQPSRPARLLVARTEHAHVGHAGVRSRANADEAGVPNVAAGSGRRASSERAPCRPAPPPPSDAAEGDLLWAVVALEAVLTQRSPSSPGLHEARGAAAARPSRTATFGEIEARPLGGLVYTYRRTAASPIHPLRVICRRRDNDMIAAPICEQR